jgi:hypothetical protein
MLTERDNCRVAAFLLLGTRLPPSPGRNADKTPERGHREKDHSFSSGSIPNAQKSQSRRGSGQSTTRHNGRVTNADIYEHLEAQQESVNETDEEQILNQKLKNLAEEREAVRKEADAIWQRRTTAAGEEAMVLTEDYESKMTSEDHGSQ